MVGHMLGMGRREARRFRERARVVARFVGIADVLERPARGLHVSGIPRARREKSGVYWYGTRSSSCARYAPPMDIAFCNASASRVNTRPLS